MLHHRTVCWDHCTAAWILRTTCILMYCSQRATHRKEQERECAFINQRRSGNVGFWTLCTWQWYSSFYEQIFPIYIGILLIWYIALLMHRSSFRYVPVTSSKHIRKYFQIITCFCQNAFITIAFCSFEHGAIKAHSMSCNQQVNASLKATRTSYIQAYIHL